MLVQFGENNFSSVYNAIVRSQVQLDNVGSGHSLSTIAVAAAAAAAASA